VAAHDYRGRGIPGASTLSLSILLVADGKFVQTTLGLVIAEIPASLPPGPYSIVIRSTADGTRIREGRYEPVFTIS